MALNKQIESEKNELNSQIRAAVKRGTSEEVRHTEAEREGAQIEHTGDESRVKTIELIREYLSRAYGIYIWQKIV